MSKGNDRMVYRRADGQWVNKRNDSDRPSTVHSTQSAAEEAARQMLRRQGGGELTTKGRNGRIRGKDTIARGSGLNPPQDTEH